MRFAVMGAGAMGGMFGARLAEAGHEVLLVEVSPKIVAAIEGRGLRIVEPGGAERRVCLSVTADPEGELAADYVIFFVKNYNTESAARLAMPLVGKETTVVSLQNGWGNGETLAGAFDEQRLVVGVTYHSATVLEPGTVAHTGEGQTVVGAYDSEGAERAEAFAAALRSTGFAVAVSSAVRTEIWKKLMLNAATLPTAALTRLTAGVLGEEGQMLSLVNEVALEAVAVANHAGLEIDPDERLESIQATLLRAGPGKASMLQDIEAGRRTEIDVITGAVVREADRLGIEAPLNRALYALVDGLERGLGLR